MMKNNKKYRLDILIISLVLIVGAVLFLIIMMTREQGQRVSVSVDGKIIKEFDLLSNTQYEIEGVNGGKNLLIIQDGKAMLKEANCPDGLCVNMGKIDQTGQSIVCLPNKVVVEVKGKDAAEKEVDLVAG